MGSFRDCPAIAGFYHALVTDHMMGRRELKCDFPVLVGPPGFEPGTNGLRGINSSSFWYP